MKKTIAAFAILASSTAAIAIAPPTQEPPKTMCLNVVSGQDRSKYAADCDDSDNNVELGKRLKQNGCAKGQVAIVTTEPISIPKCMPAGAVQL